MSIKRKTKEDTVEELNTELQEVIEKVNASDYHPAKLEAVLEWSPQFSIRTRVDGNLVTNEMYRQKIVIGTASKENIEGSKIVLYNGIAEILSNLTGRSRLASRLTHLTNIKRQYTTLRKGIAEAQKYSHPGVRLDDNGSIMNIIVNASPFLPPNSWEILLQKDLVEKWQEASIKVWSDLALQEGKE